MFYVLNKIASVTSGRTIHSHNSLATPSHAGHQRPWHGISFPRPGFARLASMAIVSTPTFRRSSVITLALWGPALSSRGRDRVPDIGDMGLPPHTMILPPSKVFIPVVQRNNQHSVLHVISIPDTLYICQVSASQVLISPSPSTKKKIIK